MEYIIHRHLNMNYKVCFIKKERSSPPSQGSCPHCLQHYYVETTFQLFVGFHHNGPRFLASICGSHLILVVLAPVARSTQYRGITYGLDNGGG